MGYKITIESIDNIIDDINEEYKILKHGEEIYITHKNTILPINKEIYDFLIKNIYNTCKTLK